MDQMIIDFLEVKAEKLARLCNISDKNRVLEILKRTAIDCNGMRFHKNRSPESPLKHGLAFYPSLYEALEFLPPESACNLFETADIDELAVKASLIRYWRDFQTPFYTLEQLSSLCTEFIENHMENKKTLISIGYPETDFAESLWYFHLLGRLYPFKIPHAVHECKLPYFAIDQVGIDVDRDAKGNLIFNYIWLTESWSTMLPSETQQQCEYEEAPAIEGLSDEDINFIEENRAKLFYLKLKILETANKYIRIRLSGSKEYFDFWEECINILSERFSSDDFRRFDGIEKKYENVFLLTAQSDDFQVVHCSPVTGISKDFNAGGMKNLLEYIFFIEKEINIGRMHRTKTDLIDVTGKNDYFSYYQFVGLPSVNRIDEILLRFITYKEEEQRFDEMQTERLAKSFKSKFKMPLLVPPRIYDAVKSFAQFIEANEKIGIDVVGKFLQSSTPNREYPTVELPPGIKWEHLTIRFINGHDVVIDCGNIRIESDFKQMGFENKQTRRPNLQWEALILLSEHNGEAIWDTRKGPPLMKKRKQLLKNQLVRYFQIEDDPFVPFEEIGYYKIKINLIPQ